MKRRAVLILAVLVVITINIHSQEKTSSQAQRKIALVIGNGSYLSSELANPENDARAMEEVLKKLGFIVYKYENLNQSQMKMAIDEFGVELKSSEVGLFYYAGHGIQFNGYNYLIPVDAELTTEKQVEYDCVQADRVLALMEGSGTEVNIIILDACRNNPFERSWTRSSTGKGLAFMNAPKGTLIAYATSPGSTASDGSGKNGLYTSAILESILIPDITILQMFQQVRSIVNQKSNGQQIPWESTSLTGDFSFYTEEIKSPGISGITPKDKPNVNKRPFSILISGALPAAPFGIKFQYCNSLGAYACFKTNLNAISPAHYMSTLGFAKSVGKKTNFFIGGGIDFTRNETNTDDGAFTISDNEIEGLIEGGFISKFGRIAIEYGGGISTEPLGYIALGIGFNF